MKVFQASDNLPGAGSQTATRQAGQKDLENLGILDIDPANLGAIQKFRNWVSNSRSEELANMFFSDNAINEMIKLANNKKKGFATIADFVNDLTREVSDINQSNQNVQNNQTQEIINLKEYQ